MQILTHPIWWVTNLQKREEILLNFEKNEKQKINDKINDYRDMVDRLLINLKAPRNEFG